MYELGLKFISVDLTFYFAVSIIAESKCMRR